MIALTVKLYIGKDETEVQTFLGKEYYEASVKMHEYISAYRVNRYEILGIKALD